MIKRISCQDAAALMASDALFALFDVRERGEYNQEQIANSTSLPRSQIEFRIAQLVPPRRIPILIYDKGGERAERAAQTLSELGYEDIAVLQGGLTAWRDAGGETASGVNVPSKAFGEKVHHDSSVPDLTPEELQGLIARGDDLTILDMRTPEEYGRFCIPGGLNVPGGDLILWAEELRRKPAVIVNCAGRTRSIIGTAGLRRLGLTNVRALRNGTMGWLLAGFALESKPARLGPPAPPESRAKARALALRLAQEENLAWLSSDDLLGRVEKAAGEMSYLIDVRSESEYADGHIAGSLNVPGGQAVQRADDFVPVRGAPIVFISNDGARAAMAAYWYRQMGFPRVFALRGGLREWQAQGHSLTGGGAVPLPLTFETARVSARYIDARELQRQLESDTCLAFDVGSSLEYEAAHVAGARWISRGWIDIKLPELYADRGRKIIVTCADGQQSTFAARQLTQVGFSDVAVLEGGVRAWSAAGLAVETGLDACLGEANDVVLSPSVRGTKEDMQNYLNWELKLKH